MIEAIAMVIGAVWLGYKWVLKRQFKYIVLPCVLLITQLSRWPLYLKYNLVFGILGLFGALMMTIEFSLKKQLTLVYPYIIILLGLSLLMLGCFFLGAC